MKTIKMLVVALILASFVTSCVPRFVDARTGQPLGRQGGGYLPQMAGGHPQGGGRVQTRVRKKLESVSVHKNQTGYCVASVQTGHENRRQEVAEFAAAYKTKNGRLPSNEAVSQHFGFRCIVKWIDTPDRVVKTVRVRPNELPPEILARF